MTITVDLTSAVSVPLLGVASQTCNVTLGNQPCRIDVFTKHIQVPVIPLYGVTAPPQRGQAVIKTSPPVYAPIDPVFLNLYLNDVLLLGGVLARHNVMMVRNTYFGFVGDLAFNDTEGSDDPQWAGLGQRWQLFYLPTLNVVDTISSLFLLSDSGTVLLDDQGNPILAS